MVPATFRLFARVIAINRVDMARLDIFTTQKYFTLLIRNVTFITFAHFLRVVYKIMIDD